MDQAINRRLRHRTTHRAQASGNFNLFEAHGLQIVESLFHVHRPSLSVYGILSIRRQELLALIAMHRHAKLMGEKKSMGRTPKEMLEWVFGETEYFHWRAGMRGLNTKKLADHMRRRLGEERSPSQSTLHRMWKGETREIDSRTLQALEEYTAVPAALIRGEMYQSAAETWGMEITITEARILRAIHELAYDQRRAIYEQVRAMLPDEKKNLVPRLPDANILKFRPKQA